MIGNLTVKPLLIKIVNMLSKITDVIEVASEETLLEIQKRYESLNDHAASYTWKRFDRPLDMEMTLEENGIMDESEDFLDLGLEEHFYIPALHLYFNDDQTVA